MKACYLDERGQEGEGCGCVCLGFLGACEGEEEPSVSRETARGREGVYTGERREDCHGNVCVCGWLDACEGERRAKCLKGDSKREGGSIYR